MLVSPPLAPLTAETVRHAHDTLLTAAAELKTAVMAKPPTSDIGRLRMNLAAAVRGHLATQQAWNAQARPHFIDRMAAYERIIEQERELRHSYSLHIGRWNGATIDADFSSYAADVVPLVNRLEHHLRSLESELYKPIIQSASENA